MSPSTQKCYYFIDPCPENVDNPVIPPTHRAPTPFIAPFPRDDEEGDYDEEDRPRSAGPARASSRHSTSRYPPPAPIQADLAHVIEPLEPASSAVFGPTGERPRTPLRNPLPPPPRDLYEMTPYKSLLSLPQTTALLTATYRPQHASLVNGAPLGPQPSVKNKKGGLLRAFSRKDKQKEPEQPQVLFIPVYVNNENQNQNPPMSANSSMRGTNLDRSHSQMSHRPSIDGPASASPSSSTMPPPVPPIPSSPPAIRFDQGSRYAVFMNHSPHRVIWRNLEYPTALHLHEALKFLDHRPDLAERIRGCKEIHEVYPLSAEYQQFQRKDWGECYLSLVSDFRPSLVGFCIDSLYSSRKFYIKNSDNTQIFELCCYRLALRGSSMWMLMTCFGARACQATVKINSVRLSWRSARGYNERHHLRWVPHSSAFFAAPFTFLEICIFILQLLPPF